jgi:hypothetical protein
MRGPVTLESGSHAQFALCCRVAMSGKRTPVCPPHAADVDLIQPIYRLFPLALRDSGRRVRARCRARHFTG